MIRVLIVEDEPPILRSLKKLIEDLNPQFKVTSTASDGEEAIHILSTKSLDVVFTDIRMPIKDGFDVLKHISTEKIDIIPIIISGYEEFEYARKALHFGVMDYLLKPVDIGSLEKLLKDLESKLTLKRNSHLATPIQHSIDEAPMELSRQDILNKLDHYIELNYAKKINHQCLSKEFGFTPSYLSKLYKEYKGVSPTEYLLELRIEKAKELMKQQPSLLTKSVSFMVGFSDPFYFSKLFKKKTGVSPKDYRRSVI